MKKETKYIAEDGTKFATEKECLAHEEEKRQGRFKKFKHKFFVYYFEFGDTNTKPEPSIEIELYREYLFETKKITKEYLDNPETQCYVKYHNTDKYEKINSRYLWNEATVLSEKIVLDISYGGIKYAGKNYVQSKSFHDPNIKYSGEICVSRKTNFDNIRKLILKGVKKAIADHTKALNNELSRVTAALGTVNAYHHLETSSKHFGIPVDDLSPKLRANKVLNKMLDDASGSKEEN